MWAVRQPPPGDYSALGCLNEQQACLSLHDMESRSCGPGARVIWVLSATLVALIGASCQSVSPTLDCDPASLLLVVDDLPSEMVLGYESSALPDATPDSAIRSFSNSRLRVAEAIYWYADTEWAERKYTELWDDIQHWPNSELNPEVDIDLGPTEVTEHSWNCGMISDGPACAIVSRYGQVVSWVQYQFPQGSVDSGVISDISTVVERRLLGCEPTDNMAP